MLVSDRHESRIFLNPKTATATLTVAATQNGYTRVGGYHDMKRSPKWDRYQLHMFVRNPFSRFASWQIWLAKRSGPPSERAQTPKDFLDWIISRSEEGTLGIKRGVRHLYWPQVRIASHFGVTHIHRYEDLWKGIWSIPGLSVVRNLVRQHRSNRKKSAKETFSPEDVERILTYFSDDFDLLGYSREVPDDDIVIQGQEMPPVPVGG